MPVNVLIIRALLNYYLYYGDNLRIECPTGSGKMMNLFEVSKDIVQRLTHIFLRDPAGQRPVYGGTEKFQTDLYWMDLILFYEYFHRDNGAGLGASHQTGWTGLVAPLINIFGRLDPVKYLEAGKRGALVGPREALRSETKTRFETLAATSAARRDAPAAAPSVSGKGGFRWLRCKTLCGRREDTLLPGASGLSWWD
jgi:hypothetical protein